MALRIGLDFRSAAEHPCGISRYARELARGLLALRHDFELVLYAATRHGALAERIPRAIREHPRTHIVERRLPARVLRALTVLPGFELRSVTGPLALLHHTDLTYLPVSGIAEIVTVHDLAYEVSEEFHGADFRRQVGERVRDACGRSRAIVVPSASTRRDLIERYCVAPERIHVVPHGLDHVLRRAEDTDEPHRPLPQLRDAAAPFLLHVGTIEPRKNLVRVIQAFELLAPRHGDLELVLAGPRGWRTEAFDRALASSPQRGRIHVLGAVPDLTLRDLYRAARAVVYPSLYEGFGLPVGEAMVLGTPVVTSDRSSTQEISGDAAILVDPEDVDAIAAGIEQVLDDDEKRADLVGRGRRHTAELTWSRAAAKTWSVYRAVLGAVPEGVGRGAAPRSR